MGGPPPRAERADEGLSAQRHDAELEQTGGDGVVVLGHWLMAAVVVRDGELAMANTLDLVPPLQGLTWVLQVMPLFFLVGGYANATSWRSARAKGDTWATWQRARLRQLPQALVCGRTAGAGRHELCQAGAAQPHPGAG